MVAKKKKGSVPEGVSVVASNKKARRDFEITEVLETGIVLQGSEVKSIRAGNVNLRDSYVRVKQHELFLVGCHISPYEHSPSDAHEVARDRKLLAHKREIERIGVKVTQKGLTLVPLRLYFKKGRCKLEIGLGRGKKLYDKRQDIKSREAKRDIERAMRGK